MNQWDCSCVGSLSVGGFIQLRCEARTKLKTLNSPSECYSKLIKPFNTNVTFPKRLTTFANYTTPCLLFLIWSAEGNDFAINTRKWKGCYQNCWGGIRLMPFQHNFFGWSNVNIINLSTKLVRVGREFHGMRLWCTIRAQRILPMNERPLVSHQAELTYPISIIKFGKGVLFFFLTASRIMLTRHLLVQTLNIWIIAV